MIIILMGVCGVGKTTVGRMLGDKLHGEFIDADDYHSLENKEKMRRSIALTNEDRKPWLRQLNEELRCRISQNKGQQEYFWVVACSALRGVYRKILMEGISEKCVHWVHLKGEEALIRRRMENRPHPYMPVALLESQFEVLEEPQGALVVDVAQSAEEVVKEIMDAFELRRE